LPFAGAQTLPPDFFESKIRPILATNCYACHQDSQLGGLRLDSREAMLKGGGRGPAIVPGDPDNSILIKAVRQGDPKFKMPMGGKLKDAEVADLAAWIKDGAKWPATAITATSKPGQYVISAERRNFWSFVPLKNSEPPAVKDTRWAKTPIDRFVLARLEKEGMKPVKAASKRDWLRRATLDLTGMPPTMDELAAFEKDTTPDAYAKVVDRLLASPHYGERWGRFWLDIARFGEDDYRSLNPFPRGYFPYPNAHLYRDWVIEAMNDDLSYDMFVKAQLAADLLDEKIRYKMLPATGFLGLGPWYFDNGSVEVTRADERHDRVDVVTRGFLGLTVGCARCHDHKYDPIPQKDYYSLAGVFRDTEYHEYPLAPKSVVDAFKLTQDDAEKKQKQLQDLQQNLSSKLAERLALEAANYLNGVWEVAGRQKKEKDAVVEARKLDYELFDRWLRYMEKPSEKYKYKEAWQAMMKRPESKADEAKKLAQQFQDDIQRAMIAKKDIEEENEIIRAKALEGTKKKKFANKPNEFITNDDFCPGCGLELKTLPEPQSEFWTEIFQHEISDGMDVPGTDKKSPKPGVLLFRGWGLESRVGVTGQAEIAALKKDIDDQKKKLEPPLSYIHGVTETKNITDLPLHIRGNPMNLGDPVPRHFMTVLSDGDPKPFTKGSGRLELAEDITSSPLAMRVIVNRVWKEHFGTGIVDTPSNFGQAGERPTNPELLDFLASQFVKDGMSMKKLHRQIMLSAVYQLSTENDEGDAKKDPANRMYWRVDRRRMEAEEVRDSILTVSGNLDTAMGGPSAELAPSMMRRTVYGRVSRYKLDTYLQLFDFPTPSISAEKRFVTTVPLQRLFLMNSDFMQNEAEELAKRVAAEPDNPARIRKLYQIVYLREPTAEELKLGVDYLRDEPMREYEEGKKKAAPVSQTAKPGEAAPTAAPAGIAADVKATPPTVEAIADMAKPEGGDNNDMGNAMMNGVPGFGKGGKSAEVKYEITPLGRYAKVLLSSSEFLFIN
jgi:cytochrome c553